MRNWGIKLSITASLRSWSMFTYCHVPTIEKPNRLVKWCVCAWFHNLSVASNSVTLWTVAHQALLSLVFSRQEYWSGVAMTSSRRSSQPRDRTWIAGRFFTTEPPGKSFALNRIHVIWIYLNWSFKFFLLNIKTVLINNLIYLNYDNFQGSFCCTNWWLYFPGKII